MVLVCCEILQSLELRFKVIYIKIRTRCEICSKLIMKIPQLRQMMPFWYSYCQLWTYFSPSSNKSIVDSKHVNVGGRCTQLIRKKYFQVLEQGLKTVQSWHYTTTAWTDADSVSCMLTFNTPCFRVSVVNFEHANVEWQKCLACEQTL